VLCTQKPSKYIRASTYASAKLHTNKAGPLPPYCADPKELGDQKYTIFWVLWVANCKVVNTFQLPPYCVSGDLAEVLPRLPSLSSHCFSFALCRRSKDWHALVSIATFVTCRQVAVGTQLTNLGGKPHSVGLKAHLGKIS
jgi:hypothetical protein